MATQPSILSSNGTTTLPHPSAYSETIQYRSSAHVMADGSVKHQYLSTTAKRLITITWTNIPDTGSNSYDTVATGINDIVTDTVGQVVFTAPSGDQYTVTRDPQSPDLPFRAVSASGTLYWSGQLVLREV